MQTEAAPAPAPAAAPEQIGKFVVAKDTFVSCR